MPRSWGGSLHRRLQARAGDQHARTPGIVADLAVGLRYLLAYAVAIGTISAEEEHDLWRRGWAALQAASAAQAAHIQTSEPAGMFLRLVQAAIASGRAHIADPDGNEPPDPHRWGWCGEEQVASPGTVPATRYKAQGRIGRSARPRSAVGSRSITCSTVPRRRDASHYSTASYPRAAGQFARGLLGAGRDRWER